MSEIKDLDVLLPQPIEVKLGGQIYKVPGDIPAPVYLRLQQLAVDADAEGDENPTTNLEVMTELYEMLLDLFREHHPDMEELPIGLGQMVRAVSIIYSSDSAVDPTPPGAKTTAPPRGARKKTAPTRSRSASSTRSPS